MENNESSSNQLEVKLALKLMRNIYLDGLYKQRKFILDKNKKITEYNNILIALNNELESFHQFHTYHPYLDIDPSLFLEQNISELYQPNSIYAQGFNELQIAYEILVGRMPYKFMEVNIGIELVSHYFIGEILKNYCQNEASYEILMKKILISKNNKGINLSIRENEIKRLYSAIKWDIFNKIISDDSFADSINVLRFCDNKLHLKNFEKFSIISREYGLFILDLFYHFKKINVEDIDKDPVDSKILRFFPNQEQLIDYFNFLYVEKFSKKGRKVFQELLDLIICNQQMNKYQRKLFDTIVKKSESCKNSRSALRNRMCGLWLWDRCKNPESHDRIRLSEALQEAYDKKIIDSSEKENFDRIMKRNLSNAVKAINNKAIVKF